MSDRLLIGTRKGLFQVERAGGAWKIARASFLADHVSMVLPDRRDGSMLAALDHGHFGVKMHRSRDGGQSWTEITTPAYPPLPDGEEPVKDMWGRPFPTKLVKVWALEAGHPKEPGVVWC